MVIVSYFLLCNAINNDPILSKVTTRWLNFRLVNWTVPIFPKSTTPWVLKTDIGDLLCYIVVLDLDFSHPNVVECLGFTTLTRDKFFCIVMNYYQEDLEKLVEERPSLTDEELLKIISDIASGLRYLRSVNIVHRYVYRKNSIRTTSWIDWLLE